MCSKPPQLGGSSSGNMCTVADESEEAEQAGSVEQPGAAPCNSGKPRTLAHKPSLSHAARRSSSHIAHAQTGNTTHDHNTSVLLWHPHALGVMATL